MKMRNLLMVVLFLVIPLANGYAGLLDGIIKVIIPPCPIPIVHHNPTPISTDDDERHQLKKCGIIGGGGIAFHDHDKDDRPGAIEIKQWSKDAPAWRCHTRGANLLGKCTNSNCAAYSKEVVCGLGIGTFYIIKNGVLNTKPHCPICNKDVIPTSSAYNNCHYRITGRKVVAGVIINTDWQTVDNYCLLYNNDNNRVDLYSVLKIETKDLSEEKPEPEEI